MSTIAAAGMLAVPGTTTDPTALNEARRCHGRDRLWIADLSQIWGGTSWLYFAYVLDRDTRRCLGWAPHRVPHAELLENALKRAVIVRRELAAYVRKAQIDAGARGFAARLAPVPVVFGRGCRKLDVDLPKGAVPSASDLASSEAFVAAMRRELVDEEEMNEDRVWASVPEATRAIAAWIEDTYNRRRVEGKALVH